MATYQEQREREYQNKLVKRFQEELGYATIYFIVQRILYNYQFISLRN